MPLEQITNYDVPGNFVFDGTILEVSTLDDVARLVRNWEVAQFFATFLQSDADVSADSVTATITGAVTITASRAELRTGAENRIEWSHSEPDPNVGAVRFLVTPQYSGGPAATQRFFALRGPGGTPKNNKVSVQHIVGGNLSVALSGATGVSFAIAQAAWVPVAGQLYEIEAAWDITGTVLRLFVDGAIHAELLVFAGARAAASTISLGSLDASETGQDFDVDALAYWPTVQFTVPYLPIGLTLYPLDFSKLRDGLLIDNNIAPNATAQTDAILGFAESVTKAGADDVRWVVMVGGLARWFDGAAWSTSDQTPAESNTAAEVDTNKAALDLSAGAAVAMQAVIISGDGDTTPELAQNTLTYDFSAAPPDLSTCIVFGFVTDPQENPAVGVPVVVQNDAYIHGEHTIDRRTTRVVTDASGLWEVVLVESATVGLFPYTFIVGTETFRGRQVPQQATQSFNLLAVAP